MAHRAAVAVCALLGAAPLAGQAADAAALHDQLNRLRRERGSVELVLSPQLTAVAQARADSLARRAAVTGSLEPTMDDLNFVVARLRAERYRAFRWQEATIHGRSDPALVLAALGVEQPAVFTDVVTGDFLEAGVGRSLLEGKPFWVLLVALPQVVATRRELTSLADLAAVRRGVLEATNAARAAAGVAPLAANRALDEVAQMHAEAMRDQRFYAHVDRQDRQVRERLAAGGYHASTVAENIARGFFTSADVVERWMLSSGHRANILSPLLTEIGIGMAYDPSGERGEDVLWVQNFGSGDTSP
jgi:uncharacterized protein YkwD